MSQKQSAVIYLLAAIGAAFIWGFLTIPLKYLHGIGYSSQQILYYRVFASLFVIWIYNLLLRRRIIRADIQKLKDLPVKRRGKILLLLFCTGAAIGLNWFTYIYTVNHISVKVAASAYLICPLLTACGGFLILKEPLSKIKIAGLLAALISICILSTGSFINVVWAFGIAIFYAIYLVIQRVLVGFDNINMLAVQVIIASLIMLPFYIHDYSGLPTLAGFWINIIVLAVVFTLVPLLLSLYALKGIPSSTLGITIYLNPIVTFLVAYAYFHETFAASQLAGYLLLLLSVIIFNWEIISSAYQSKSGVKQV